MDDLITWLRAQIDEDEEAARSASLRPGTPWAVAAEQPKVWGDPESDTLLIGGGKPVATFTAEYGGAFNAQHVERWDPARVLAECEAKRRIIALCQLDFNDDGQPICLGGYGEAYWDMVREYGVMYAQLGRPGYREEWRP